MARSSLTETAATLDAGLWSCKDRVEMKRSQRVTRVFDVLSYAKPCFSLRRPSASEKTCDSGNYVQNVWKLQ
jgi:hypothetical protein